MQKMAIMGLLVLLGFMLSTRVMTTVRRMRRRGKPIPGLADVAGPENANKDCLLLYFYNQGCGKCRTMTPRIDRLAQDCDAVVKVDADEHRDWAISLGVSGLPTIAIVRRGHLAELIYGNTSEQQLRNKMDIDKVAA